MLNMDSAALHISRAIQFAETLMLHSGLVLICLARIAIEHIGLLFSPGTAPRPFALQLLLPRLLH